MKLNAIQLAWLLGAAAMFVAILLDIAGLLRVPSLYWLVGFGLLALVGARVMPSLAELSRANRRTRR